MSQNICGRDITARMDTKFKIIDLSFMKNLTFYAQSIWPCDIEHDSQNIVSGRWIKIHILCRFG